MPQIQSKAIKFASFVAIGAIALSGALSAPMRAHAGMQAGTGARVIQACKWATKARTVKAPYTVPDSVTGTMPASVTGCIVRLNQTYAATDGTVHPAYSVEFYAGKTFVMRLTVSHETDSDGTANDYYMLSN